MIEGESAFRMQFIYNNWLQSSFKNIQIYTQFYLQNHSRN